MTSWIAYSFFLSVALKGTLALGVAWIAALLLYKSSAAVRHLVWGTAMAALLVLPLLALALPALPVSIADSLLSPGLIFQVNASAGADDTASSSGHLEAAASGTYTTSPLRDWRLLLLLVWAAGATVSLSQMCIGCATLRRQRRKSNRLSMPGFGSLADLLGVKDKVELLEAAPGSMPMTYGVRRQAIFMPLDAEKWSADRRRVVLLHELAHVRRRDSATHLVARTALGLYWWNPLAWAAWREFLKEREKAADDVVLGAGGRASDYATHLLEIARSLQAPSVFGWAAVAIARRSQLEGRLLAILDANRNRKVPGFITAMAASLVAIAFVVPLAAMQAQGSGVQTSFSLQADAGPAAELIRAGDLQREQGKLDAAKALYTKVLALSNSGPDAATAYLHLGTVELAAKNIEQAIVDFEQAQTADPAKAGEALMWIAIARERQNNLEAADFSFQSALAAVNPDSPFAATIMEIYAQLLSQQGRQDESETMRRQAAEIRRAQGVRAAATSPSSDVSRIGGDVKAPVLVSKIEPEYTAEARVAKYQGTVMLWIEIDTNGFARNIHVVRGLGLGLDQKAIEALSQWRFKPGMRNGQPVKVAATVEVNFRLL